MSMKRCPVCGEKYSDTYRTCPFCEEEDALKEGEPLRRPARRTVSRSRQYSLVTPTLIVLILIMAALLVYLLYGDQIGKKKDGADAQAPQDGVITPVQPNPAQPDVPDETDPGTTDPGTTDPDGGAADPAGTDSPDNTPSGAAADPAVPDYDRLNALPSGLSLNTTDFTLKSAGETAKIRVIGGSSGAAITFASEDEGIASVDAEGKVTAVSRGTVNIVASDGSKKGVCIVRCNIGAASAPPASTAPAASPAPASSGSGGGAKLNKSDFTRSTSEGPYKLKLSGVATAVTWSSSDSSVATVSGDGTVTPVGKGTATITASWDGQSRTCIVRVPG